jgi:MFS family permease
MTTTPQLATSEPRITMFASLRIRNYRLFTIGQTVSVGGSWMQNIATGWLALQLSHHGAVLGIVVGARFLPVLLFGPWGGLIADRLDNRRLLAYTQACLAVISTVLAVLSQLGRVTLPVLLILVICLGFVTVFDGPSRQILINQLVERRHLRNAIALNSVLMNVAKMIGPALAGVVIATVGVTPCFFLNAGSYLAVILSLVLMRSSELLPASREVRAKGQIRAGLTYVSQTSGLLYPLLMVTVTGILTWEFPVTLPLITTLTFHAGASAYGAAMACMSVGAVCGGLIAARGRRSSVRLLAISAMLWGALIVAAALAPTLPIEFAVLVLVGSAAVTFNSSAKTLLQLNSRPDMRGRVMSLWSIAWQGGTVIGGPVVGTVASIFGARYSLMVGGVASLGIGAIVLALREGSSAASGDKSPDQWQLAEARPRLTETPAASGGV